MKKLMVLVGVLTALAMTTGAWATSYSGVESDFTTGTSPYSYVNGTTMTSYGINALGNAWMGVSGCTNGNCTIADAQGVQMNWSVDNTTNPNYWTYTYTFTQNTGVNSKNIVSFYLGFGGTLSDISSEILDGYTSKNATGTSTLLNISPTLGSYASPSGGPGTISGLDWNFAGSYYSFTLTLVTTDAPVWGDYLSVGPVAAGNGATLQAWDLNFGIPDSDPIGPGPSYNGYDWVMTPGASAVPIPPSVLLLAGGLGGFGLIRRRRAKR